MRYLAFALALGLLMGSAGMAAACSYTTASKDQVLAAKASDQTSSDQVKPPAKGKDTQG